MLKNHENRFGRQKYSAILLAGCKKTRPTLRFSCENRSRPKVYFEFVLPLGHFHVECCFSQGNTRSAGGAAIVSRDAAGAPGKNMRFSSGKPVFFKPREPLNQNCCSTKSCSCSGLAGFCATRRGSCINAFSTETQSPLGFGCVFKHSAKFTPKSNQQQNNAHPGQDSL